MSKNIKWIVYVDRGMVKLRGDFWRLKTEFQEFNTKKEAMNYYEELESEFENVVIDTMNKPDPTKFQIVI